jgi:hypothetical protein
MGVRQRFINTPGRPALASKQYISRDVWKEARFPTGTNGAYLLIRSLFKRVEDNKEEEKRRACLQAKAIIWP